MAAAGGLERDVSTEGMFLGSSSREWARFVFYAYLALSLPVLLFVGRDRWFFSDEWSFLTARSATNVHDLLAPNNQHWSTIPVIVYRVLYALFGLREYWPYQMVAIVTHLAVAALLRHIMRRSGVRPWFATAVAAAYVLFGPGVRRHPLGLSTRVQPVGCTCVGPADRGRPHRPDRSTRRARSDPRVPGPALFRGGAGHHRGHGHRRPLAPRVATSPAPDRAAGRDLRHVVFPGTRQPAGPGDQAGASVRARPWRQSHGPGRHHTPPDGRAVRQLRVGRHPVAL